MRKDNARSSSSFSSLLYVTLPFLGVILIAGPVEASAGCGQEGIDSGVYTLTHDGVERIYRVHVPSGYENTVAAPVVTFFHGWGGNEDEFAANEQITREADRRGYILVAPRGIGSGDPDHKANSWTFSGSATGLDGDGVNAGVDGDTDAICDDSMTSDYSYGSCAASKSNTCSWTHCQADDVDFAVHLVKEIEAKLCVDAAGFSRWADPTAGCTPGTLGRTRRVRRTSGRSRP